MRPANLPAASPGRGETVVRAADGTQVDGDQPLGRMHLEPAVSPFEVGDRPGRGGAGRGRRSCWSTSTPR